MVGQFVGERGGLVKLSLSEFITNNLSPGRLQKLLEDCKSVTVKRLVFFPTAMKKIERSRIELDKGKRMLVRGGKFSSKYQVTVPEDLDGAQ